MTRSAAIALAVSLAVHALLAVALIGCPSFVSAPETAVELDLSSVELSFSEQEESAPPAPPPASAPSDPAPPPRTVERPPAPPPDLALPPDPGPIRCREPGEPATVMDAPPRPPAARKEPPKPASAAAPAAAAPSRPAPRQARVDAPPRPKRAIRPHYPQGARQRGEEGRVVLEIEVGADGACTAVRVLSSCGFAELDAAAVRAVRSARFMPARSGSAPVASTARLALDFRLR